MVPALDGALHRFRQLSQLLQSMESIDRLISNVPIFWIGRPIWNNHDCFGNGVVILREHGVREPCPKDFQFFTVCVVLLESNLFANSPVNN